MPTPHQLRSQTGQWGMRAWRSSRARTTRCHPSIRLASIASTSTNRPTRQQQMALKDRSGPRCLPIPRWVNSTPCNSILLGCPMRLWISSRRSWCPPFPEPPRTTGSSSRSGTTVLTVRRRSLGFVRASSTRAAAPPPVSCSRACRIGMAPWSTTSWFCRGNTHSPLPFLLPPWLYCIVCVLSSLPLSLWPFTAPSFYHSCNRL